MTPRTVVVGLGSPIMGDDGIGIAALEQLQREWVLEGVELVDGGIWGMSLLPVVEDAERLLLVDAISAGGVPGDVITLERDRLPIYLERKLSPHQVDIRDVLAVAELRGRLPQDTVAIGIQPLNVELSTSLSDVAGRSVDALVAAVVQRLVQWGHICTRVTEPARA